MQWEIARRCPCIPAAANETQPWKPEIVPFTTVGVDRDGGQIEGNDRIAGSSGPTVVLLAFLRAKKGEPIEVDRHVVGTDVEDGQGGDGHREISGQSVTSGLRDDDGIIRRVPWEASPRGACPVDLQDTIDGEGGHGGCEQKHQSQHQSHRDSLRSEPLDPRSHPTTVLGTNVTYPSDEGVD